MQQTFIPVLDEPLTLQEILNLRNSEDNSLKVIIKVSLWDLVDCLNIYEYLVDLIEDKVVGDLYPDIQDIDYEVWGHEDDKILLLVTGSVDEIVQEAKLDGLEISDNPNLDILSYEIGTLLYFTSPYSDLNYDISDCIYSLMNQVTFNKEEAKKGFMDAFESHKPKDTTPSREELDNCFELYFKEE